MHTCQGLVSDGVPGQKDEYFDTSSVAIESEHPTNLIRCINGLGIYRVFKWYLLINVGTSQ